MSLKLLFARAPFPGPAFLLALFWGCLALLLGGCGGDDQNPPPARKAPAHAAPVTRPPAEPRITGPWPPPLPRGESVLQGRDLLRRNVVLVFDGSGSMADTRCGDGQPKVEVARRAVAEWAASLPPDAGLGLVVFDESGFSVRLPLGVGNREAFAAEISRIRPNYKTPLSQALARAYAMLGEQAARQLGYGEYTIVVVTDGMANDPALLARTVDAILANSPVMISTIGFCISGSHTLNQEGRTLYRAANNPEELRQGLRDVLAEAPDFDLTDFQ